MVPKLHLGKYFRYIHEELDLLVIRGDFSEVDTSRRLYNERYAVGPLPAEADRALRRLMGAAALAAVSLADRESWGWSLTLAGADRGYFVGVEPEGMICGRTDGAEVSKNAAYVQRQKGNAPLTQSFFEPVDSDPASAVTRYFEQVVQLKTRIVLEESCAGLLVQALPGGSIDIEDAREDSELLAYFDDLIRTGGLKPVGEVLIFYECRCDDEMVLDMITSLPEAERRAVWGDERTLEIACPRCGREYRIERPVH